MTNNQVKQLEKSAKITVEKILGVKPGEKVFVLTNPVDELDKVALSLVQASHNIGAEASLVYQGVKGPVDFMEPQVLESFKREPDVYIGVNADSTGVDPEGTKKSYAGVKSHLAKQDIRFFLFEKKKMRGFWFQKAAPQLFSNFVDIDMDKVQMIDQKLSKKLSKAQKVVIKTGVGEELTIDISKHKPMADIGKFSKPGDCGNIPFGETFVSPTIGKTNGTILLDGVISLSKGMLFINKPIKVTFKDGLATKFEGGAEAEVLRKDFQKIRRNIRQSHKKGLIQKNELQTYLQNTVAIGELGFGFNDKARLYKGVGVMEAEKIYGSIHIAFGRDYDGDVQAMNHMDAVTKEPGVELIYPDDKREVVLQAKEYNL